MFSDTIIFPIFFDAIWKSSDLLQTSITVQPGTSNKAHSKQLTNVDTQMVSEC